MIEVHIPLVFCLHHTTRMDLALNWTKYANTALPYAVDVYTCVAMAEIKVKHRPESCRRLRLPDCRTGDT
jgi:hypothetical protein